MEEWLEHHIALGVDHFYLYDNSSVQVVDDHDKKYPITPGVKNKFGISYDDLVSDDEMHKMYDSIKSKYQNYITVIPWKHTDERSRVVYDQDKAIIDFIERARNVYDYAVSIDMDEFLFSRQGYNLKDLARFMELHGVTSGYLAQRRFISRFTPPDGHIGRVRDIHLSFLKDTKALPKTVFKISAFIDATIYSVHKIETFVQCKYIDNNVFIINHYNETYRPQGAVTYPTIEKGHKKNIVKSSPLALLLFPYRQMRALRKKGFFINKETF